MELMLTTAIAIAAFAAGCSVAALLLMLRFLRAQREHGAELREAREELARASASLDALGGALSRMGASVAALTQHASGAAALDRERHEALGREFGRASAKMDELRRELAAQLEQSREVSDVRLGEVRTAVERQLGAIRSDNERQLDRMRATVDEKLQRTLDSRLSQSFKQVSDQLEAVYKGLGDMQGIAAGVGDLKRVLGNVKTRGILGEVQLGAILADILAPEQYVQNAVTKPGSSERVEYAVRIPVEGGEPVLLPIDAKFPGDAYEHLRAAIDTGDADAVAAARRQLEQRIRAEARDISEKYLSVPQTTNFAIMFLPFEGLYAEVVDMPGLVEGLQRDHQVSVAGPSTMAAILSSLQMSYQSFAFQRRADEIQKVLSAVKAELPRYQAALQKAYDQINRAGNTVETLMTTRTRAIERRLRSVTAMGDEDELARILGEGAAPLQVDALDEGPLPLPADAFGIGEAGGADGSSPDDARGHHAGAEGTASVGTASGARGGDAGVDGADRDGSADDLNGEDA